MSDPDFKALLPQGLRDTLPPDGDHAADMVDHLRRFFRSHGYLRVKPPLVEFEESLLAGPGAAMVGETFRLMDPVSQRMMGLRSDITVQIARIASTRLGRDPRPLRLAYDGDVLRVRGRQLRPERQFTQIGAELIGTDALAADLEVIVMAVEALRSLGIERLSVDLTQPTLIPALLAADGLDGEAGEALRAALDRKDAAAVAAAAPNPEPYGRLLAAAGPADRAIAAINGLDLAGPAAAAAGQIVAVAEELARALPDLTVTIDPVENRGFEYHTGVSFTIFSRGVRGEIGSGGHYIAGRGIAGQREEPATGFTLYLDTILRALPDPAMPPRVFVPGGTAPADAAALRADGWITVSGLGDGDGAEARRLGCTHIAEAGRAVPLDTMER
jgi:ATP phosphoribosyltransferase regulatory subunit